MARETDLIYKFAIDPTISNDSANGYQVGNDWINTISGEVWSCIDSSVGAAVWKSVTESIKVTRSYVRKWTIIMKQV